MNDVYSLLNINKDALQDFMLWANSVADHQTEKVVNKNLSKLKHIEQRVLVDKGLKMPEQSIDEVIGKVIRMVPSGDTSGESWTSRELRIVSYYLMKLRGNDTNYRFALNLLRHNWRDLFFNGLVFYLMNSWNSIEPNYRALTSNLLMEKLEEYEGSNRRYNIWKKRLNLFDSNNGPTRMAALLAAKGIGILEAPTLLGVKPSSLKQSYYSDVIIKYVVNNDITNREAIEEIFERHSLDRTKKLLFAYMVEKEDRIADGLRRSQLCRFASIELGDVTLAASWAPFTGATETDAQKLKKAMKLVNIWFAQQIIETFFEMCVQDKERKAFWLKYVNDISTFKIVGSTITKQKLQSNSKIGSMFLRHFIETNSQISQTSALVLFIRDKMLVEFSDIGALYAYNQTHNMAKKVTSSQHCIASTNDLKTPWISGIVEKDSWGNYSIYNQEGKLSHRGDWQGRLSAWLRIIVLSPSNMTKSLIDKRDDDIFKAKPLPAESFNYKSLEQKLRNSKGATAIDAKDGTDTSSPSKEGHGFKYNIASKFLEHNVQVVANAEGFHLSLGQKHYSPIRPFKPGEGPTGSIWIKKAPLQDWKEIVHNYEGSSTRSVGFIRITSKEVIFKESLSVAGKTRHKLY